MGSGINSEMGLFKKTYNVEGGRLTRLCTKVQLTTAIGQYVETARNNTPQPVLRLRGGSDAHGDPGEPLYSHLPRLTPGARSASRDTLVMNADSAPDSDRTPMNSEVEIQVDSRAEDTDASAVHVFTGTPSIARKPRKRKAAVRQLESSEDDEFKRRPNKRVKAGRLRSPATRASIRLGKGGRERPSK